MLNFLLHLILVLLLQVEVVCPVTNTDAGGHQGHRPQPDVSLGAHSPPVSRGR